MVPCKSLLLITIAIAMCCAFPSQLDPYRIHSWPSLIVNGFLKHIFKYSQMIASINKVIWNKHILVVSVNKIKFWRNSGNLQYSGKCIHMFHACMSFSILRFWVNLPISFKDISWALGNHTTSPVPVTESYQIITWKLWYSPKQRHTRKIICIYHGLLCISCKMEPLNLSLKTAHNPHYLDDDGYIYIYIT